MTREERADQARGFTAIILLMSAWAAGAFGIWQQSLGAGIFMFVALVVLVFPIWGIWCALSDMSEK